MINLLKKIIESLYFIRIAFLPFLIGFILGGLVYLFLDKSKTGLFLFEIFSLVGLAVGIYWAVFISKKESPSEFFTHPTSDEEEQEIKN
jgi:hypothetical protein